MADHDTLIVQALKEGNQKALEEIYNRYYTSVFLLAKKFVSTADAEDIAVKSFLRIWELREQLRVENMSAVYSWLRTTTRNACLDLLRSQKLRASKESEIRVYLMQKSEEEVFEANDYEAAIVERLLQQIDNLPLPVKQVFELRFLEELKFREIGDILAIDTSAAKKRYARAVELLKIGVSKKELILLSVLLYQLALLFFFSRLLFN